MRMNKKGVTLVELIVVIVIIAIGAVLLVPNIGAFLPNYRLRGAARDMVSTMRVAQMKAVSNNMEYQVSIAAGSYVLQRNSGGVWFSEGDDKTFPTGITINSNTFTNPAGNPLFRPNSSSNGGTLVLQNTKGNQRTITVLPSTGRITVQ
jgi:prepilin-type N-terminal cleavage/methylation domain-containing protein